MPCVDKNSTLGQKGDNNGIITNDVVSSASEDQIDWLKKASGSGVVVASWCDVNSKERSFVKCENMATEPEILSDITSAVVPPVERENEEPDVLDDTAATVEDEKFRDVTGLEPINADGSSHNNTTLPDSEAAMVVIRNRRAELRRREEEEGSRERVDP